MSGDVETTFQLGNFSTILEDARLAPLVAVVSPDDLLNFRIDGERVWFVGLGRSVERMQWFIVPEEVLAASARTVVTAIATPIGHQGDQT